METFPAEFRDLLRGRQRERSQAENSLREGGEHVAWFPHALRPDATKMGVTLLERHMQPYLRTESGPIPPTSITSMRSNYTERLSKTLRNRSFSLNDERSKTFAAASRIGLPQMMGSSSLRRFAEAVSGYQLEAEPGLQVICYRPGDYVGPHNDHHPEEPHLRHGYVDLQITLCNSGVGRQYLLYENNGYFNAVVNVAVDSGVSVSLLPFWHQVTPMEAKRGREQMARRWLLLVSFVIDWPSEKRKSRALGFPLRKAML